MPGTKEIKTRIKSIQGIQLRQGYVGQVRKVTKAMRMVSAAKMRKAQSGICNFTFSEASVII